jgi:hypothetical protein
VTPAVQGTNPDRNRRNSEGSTVESLRINHRAQGKGNASSVAAVALAVTGLALPLAARASFLPPELMDKAAMGIARRC